MFPISPEIMMYCYGRQDSKYRVLGGLNNTLSPVEFTASLVEHDNAGQVFSAGRFVISPVNDFKFVREFAETIGTDPYAPHRRVISTKYSVNGTNFDDFFTS
jgi:hypothetical protein